VTWWNKTGRVRLEADQCKHSANFLGVDIIVNKSGHLWYETWHTVAADAPWEASSLTIEGLGKVAMGTECSSFGML